MSVRIVDLPLFSIEDLNSRWTLARVGALEKALSQGDGNFEFVSKSGTMLMEQMADYEQELLKKVSDQFVQGADADFFESVLRNVFDHSRKLGMSLVRYIGHSFELSDLADILPNLGSPCFSHQWRVHNQAYVLSRKGCEGLRQITSIYCDYWREALDGFVMGAGTDERLARHRSLGHGDEACEDILFLETEYKKVVGEVSRWGSIPLEMESQLVEQSTAFMAKGYALAVHGYSEGQLYYEMKAKTPSQCGPGERLMANYFEEKMRQIFPDLKLSEISPQSVLDHKDH